MDASTSSMPMPRAASLLGIELHAHRELRRPEHVHLRDAVDGGDARARSGSRRTRPRLRGETVCELRPMNRMGWSAGFTFCTVGGAGMFGGSRRITAEMADCTSCAAASMLRSSTNCRVMLVLPADAGRRHRIEARNGGELAFQRGGHRGGHGLRTRAGQAGLHLEGREVDVRQIAHRQRRGIPRRRTTGCPS